MSGTVTVASFWKKIETETGRLPDYLREAIESITIPRPEWMKRTFSNRPLDQIIDILEEYLQRKTNDSNFSLQAEDITALEIIKKMVITRPTEFWSKRETVEPNSKRQKFINKEYSLLEMLNFSGRINEGKDARGFRYNTIAGLKQVCAYIFIMGGRILYSFFQKNLPIPNETTVKKIIAENTDEVMEGSLRVEALKKHLLAHKTSLDVWLSENGSGTVKKFQYDATNNTLSGLILPTDENSMPIKMYFKATSAKEIENNFRANTVSSILYIYMAQANDPTVPPFCLLFFGTDNRMSFTDVVNRQNFISNELKKVNITVLGYSGNGDTRVLKAMRLRTKLGKRCFANDKDFKLYQNIPGFHAEFLTERVPLQDTVHITNRGRTRLFESFLPMGDYLATSNDLLALVNFTTVDQHLLCIRDLMLNKKTNFASTMKICHPRTWELLDEHVPGSKGTQMYLKIMFLSTQAMLSTNLSVLQRIHCIFYCIYFLRMWRSWLKLNEKHYSEVDNFITVNMYSCLEVNAHGLLNLILKCLKNDDFSKFYPWIYSSQACVGFVRLLRSTASKNSAMVNCSILRFSNRIKRMEMLSSILSTEFTEFPMEFPSDRVLSEFFEKQTTKFRVIKKFDTEDSEVSIESIINVLQDAKTMAHNDCKNLGMIVDISAALEIQLKFTKIRVNNRSFVDVEDNEEDEDVEVELNEDDEETFEVDPEVDPEDMNLFLDDYDLAPSREEMEIFSEFEEETDFPECLETDPNHRPEGCCVTIKDKNNKIRSVKKSSLCWFFDNHRILNIDRLKTFQEDEEQTTTYDIESSLHLTKPTKEPIIRISDYCIFYIPQKNCYLIGLVKGFAIITEKEDQDRMINKMYVEISDDNQENVGVLATWFTVKLKNRTLNMFPVDSHTFVSLKYYNVTIPPPIVVNNKRNVLHEATFNEISSLVKLT